MYTELKRTDNPLTGDLYPKVDSPIDHINYLVSCVDDDLNNFDVKISTKITYVNGHQEICSIVASKERLKDLLKDI